MKTIFKSIFAALPAMAFWACSNPDILEELRPGETVNLTISADRPDMVDTRTMVDTDGKTPMWCPEDAIGVSVLSNGSYTNHEFTNDNTDAPSVTTSFSGSVAVGDMIYTYYPYTKGNVTAGQISMTIPDVQYPTPTSFDGAADILVGKPVVMTPATTTVEGLQFKRVGGFLKIVLNNATSGNIITGEMVESVSVTAQSTLAGHAYLDIVNGELDKIHANRSVKVTAKYSSDTEYKIGDEKSAAYLGVYPQTLAKGSTIIISAKTAFYDIEREIELPDDIEIKAGGITTLKINIDTDNIERTLYIDEMFPDPIFRQYVLDNFDTDHNGILSKEECAAVTEINVNKYYYAPVEERIASLEGIQYFTNLTTLLCDYNQLTTLDLSQNTALTSLECCHNNQLTTLNVSGCSALTYLSCNSNQLTTLNVSGCTALTDLSCSSNQLTTLDVSGCSALTYLSCWSNQLTTLDVSGCTALTYLWCEWNQLTTLDVSGCTALTTLECDWNQLTTLGVSGCTALTTLECTRNQLTTLDVSDCTALKWLYCYNNQLTTLDASGCTALEWLSCDNNQLTTLDVSNNTALKTLDCGSNQLTTLDVSNNTALTKLSCLYNQLTALDVSGCTALEFLDCNNNQLTTLNVSGCTALELLGCDWNQLTTLDLSNNTALRDLYCEKNQLTTLDLSKNTALKWLWCYNNQLTTLDVSKTNLNGGTLKCAPMETLQTLYLKTGWAINGITPNRYSSFIPEHTKILFVDEDGNIEADDNIEQMFPDPVFRQYVLDNFDTDRDGILSKEEMLAVTRIGVAAMNIKSLEGVQYFANLEYLNCEFNKLTTLDLSNNTALTELWCHYNKLTTLDVSNNTALKTLYCCNNQLTALDLSNNTALTMLWCYENQLTTLDVSGCTALTDLKCYSNLLTTLDLSKTKLGNSPYTHPLYCAPMETLQTLYLKKGWEIKGITLNRSDYYIPNHTEIEFVD